MPRTRALDLRRLGVTLLVVLGLGLIVKGFSMARTGSSSTGLPVGVERVVPNDKDLVLRQSTVGADLATGYRGVLVINGQEIPTYDVGTASSIPADAAYDAQYDLSLGTLYFTPRRGATIEKFPPGLNRITLIYWKTTESRDSAQTYSWQFKVS